MNKVNLPENVRQWLFMGLQVMIVLLAMAIGYFGHRYILQAQEDLGILKQARSIVEENAIFELPSDEKLQHGMVRGMLESLNDPYTFFVEPAVHEIQTDELAGSFGGIGVRLERDTELNWRLYPFSGSPALQAGVQDGDILIEVDDLTITTSTDDINLLAALRGPIGEQVQISVRRGSQTLNFSIDRQDFPLPTVSWNLLPEAADIGLIKVNRIAETTADEMRDAIKDLQDRGAEYLVLDLRDNGGGLVEAGVEIVKLFLMDGEVLYQQFNDQKVEIFKVSNEGEFSKLPMVLLVNGNTASSAEIVAGALKKHERALIIGTSTYGKTSIQYIFDLQDGASIHVTSGRWWIPGVSFPLAPDYPVTEDPSGIAAMQKAVEILRDE
ncbi:MAG: S41 family peptidase [Brevefilum sp.]|nr:S41 family peptidase [Brevefilum sp.]MDT8380845.1 S41 family peptidase [Brevefilum sp.]MDW7755187.1 S41 family peptidase [Brevefilum sp.]